MTLGEKIKNLRKSKDFTQLELGKRLGLAESTISLYESNKNKPDIDVLKRLAEIFDVTVNDLIGEKVEEKPNYILTTKEHLELNFISSQLTLEEVKIMKTIGLAFIKARQVAI